MAQDAGQGLPGGGVKPGQQSLHSYCVGGPKEEHELPQAQAAGQQHKFDMWVLQGWEQLSNFLNFGHFLFQFSQGESIVTSAGHLLWIYRQLIGMSYIALARQAWTYRNVLDTRIELDPAEDVWK